MQAKAGEKTVYRNKFHETDNCGEITALSTLLAIDFYQIVLVITLMFKQIYSFALLKGQFNSFFLY